MKNLKNNIKNHLIKKINNDILINIIEFFFEYISIKK